MFDALAPAEEQLKDLRRELSPERYEAFIQDSTYSTIMDQYETFCKEDHGALFNDLDSYIEMIL